MSDNPTRKTFRSGEELLREGAPNNNAFLITKGKVEIRTGTYTSNPNVVARLGKGEVIGEMSLFDDQTPMASAIAVEETETIVLSKGEFKRRLQGMDPVMRSVLGVLIKRLRESVVKSMRVGRNDDEQWARWKKKD